MNLPDKVYLFCKQKNAEAFIAQGLVPFAPRPNGAGIETDELRRYQILNFLQTENPANECFKYFKANCFITIYDLPAFCQRIQHTVGNQFPDWEVEYRSVGYHKAENSPLSTLDRLFLKDEGSDWQEFRVALIAPMNEGYEDPISLMLGSLSDICTLTTKSQIQ